MTLKERRVIQIRTGSVEIMAHRNQLKIHKDNLHRQRPNIFITKLNSNETASDMRVETGENQESGEGDMNVLPKGRILGGKRKREAADTEAQHLRRSKRKKKATRREDYHYE
ncbi:uncharacterized protein LOC134215460 [Armigeres subalbatus]|uniref:uncharacterized protein LOC134215460 n=1 Tax=Armigeres subalbatus TaxID=124917 RepID=UPI002ED4CB74